VRNGLGQDPAAYCLAAQFRVARAFEAMQNAPKTTAGAVHAELCVRALAEQARWACRRMSRRFLPKHGRRLNADVFLRPVKIPYKRSMRYRRPMAIRGRVFGQLSPVLPR